MRIATLALLVLGLVASRSAAVDIVEMKNGKLYEAAEVSFVGDKLRIRLHRPQDAAVVVFAVPIDRVVPEFVYYAWDAGIEPGDTDEHVRLAAWARTQGLFAQALQQYEEASTYDEELNGRLDALKKELHEEEATWQFQEGWRLFEADEVAAARVHAQRVLDRFADTKELKRAEELLTIIAEREQFLGEQKKLKDLERRVKKQRREIAKYDRFVQRADELASKARLHAEFDAHRKLTWAAYAYRKTSWHFQDMLPYAESEAVAQELQARVEAMQPRLTRTFLKLADLRYLIGDSAGALDAVHEVMALDPDHKAATGLRERILEDRSFADRPTTVASYGYPSRVFFRRRFRLIGHKRLYAVPGAIGLCTVR